jgi:hypothetical protein
VRATRRRGSHLGEGTASVCGARSTSMAIATESRSAWAHSRPIDRAGPPRLISNRCRGVSGVPHSPDRTDARPVWIGLGDYRVPSGRFNRVQSRLHAQAGWDSGHASPSRQGIGAPASNPNSSWAEGGMARTRVKQRPDDATRHRDYRKVAATSPGGGRRGAACGGIGSSRSHRSGHRHDGKRRADGRTLGTSEGGVGTTRPTEIAAHRGPPVAPMLVLVGSSGTAEPLGRRIQSIRRESHWDKEFHFSKTPDKVRKTFLRAMASVRNVCLRAVIVPKGKIRSAFLRDSDEGLYNYIVRPVLEHDDGRIREAKLFIDKRGPGREQRPTARRPGRGLLSTQADRRHPTPLIGRWC